MATKFSFEQLPNDTGSTFEKGQHKLTIAKAEQIIAGTGTLMLQLTHKIDDTDSEIRYDNYSILKPDMQTPISYGLAKLKKLLQATGVTFQGEWELEKLPKMLATLLVGKSFLVDLDYDKKDEEKKYLRIVDIESFKPFYPGVNQTKPVDIQKKHAETIATNPFITINEYVDSKFDANDEEDV